MSFTGRAVPNPFTFIYERISPLRRIIFPSVSLLVLFKVTFTFCFPELAAITVGVTVKPFGAVIVISLPSKASELTMKDDDAFVPLIVSNGRCSSVEVCKASFSFLSSSG
jgi:hypothetical protein